MTKETLLNILKLDSIAHLLDWEERIRIHLYMSGRAKTTTPKILAIGEWIERYGWLPPEVRYGQDRLLYYENKKDDWRPIEELEDKMKTIKIL